MALTVRVTAAKLLCLRLPPKLPMNIAKGAKLDILDKKSALFLVACLVPFLAMPAFAHNQFSQNQTAIKNWVGTYKYEENSGYDGGGSSTTGEPIIIDFILTVNKNGDCALKAEGYQTDESIVCEVKPTSPAIEITFKSYQNGMIVNKYGIAQYKPDSVLFTLKVVGSKIITTWRAFNNDPPLSAGVYFRKDAVQK